MENKLLKLTKKVIQPNFVLILLFRSVWNWSDHSYCFIIHDELQQEF